MMKAGLFRRVVLTIHLIVGLIAALILIVVGLTGAALAYRDNYVRWVHPSFFTSKACAQPLSEDAMVAAAEKETAPARVETALMLSPVARLYFLDKHGPLWVNRYTGEVLDAHTGKSWNSKLVINSTQLHTKLMAGNTRRCIAGTRSVNFCTPAIPSERSAVAFSPWVVCSWSSRRLRVSDSD